MRPEMCRRVKITMQRYTGTGEGYFINSLLLIVSYFHALEKQCFGEDHMYTVFLLDQMYSIS